MQIIGVNIIRLSALAFALAFGLAGVTGVLIALVFPAFSPFSGGEYSIIGFIVIVLGGLGNPIGALIAGVFFGIAEQMATVFLPQALAQIVGFAHPGGHGADTADRPVRIPGTTMTASGTAKAAVTAQALAAVTAAIEVRGLTKRFGGLTALEDVGFSAQAGQVLGIIGVNGAGKTTLMNCICGIYKPDSRPDQRSTASRRPAAARTRSRIAASAAPSRFRGCSARCR